MFTGRSHHRRMISPGARAFNVVNTVILVFLGLICLLPYINLLAKSLSSEAHVIAGDILFWPKGFNMDAYTGLLTIPNFKIAFRNSLITTVLATAVHTFFTIAIL